MRKISRNTVVFLIMLISLTACQDPPETADTVIRKVLSAHGKDNAMLQIEGLLYHGHIRSLTEESHGKLWINFRQPEKLRVAVELEKAREDRLYLDGRGWRDAGRGFVKATGVDYDLMKFQTEHLSLPLGLQKGKYKVRLDEEIIANEPIRLLLTDVTGIETKISIDPVRWVVRTVERVIEVNGKPAIMGVVYEEYRTIKGVQLPHRILNFINGKVVGQTDFSSIQINPSIPENIFSAPGE